MRATVSPIRPDLEPDTPAYPAKILAVARDLRDLGATPEQVRSHSSLPVFARFADALAALLAGTVT